MSPMTPLPWTSTERGPEDEIPEEASMDDRRPDRFLIDLQLTPWFQLSISVRGIHEGEEVCLGWSPQQGPPQCDDAHVVVPRTQVCKSVNYPDGE